MLVTQPSTFVEPERLTLPEDSLPSWKEIITPAEPFLQAVADRLREQINAFERDIAAYAEYALTNQGKQLRPVLVALSGGASGRIDESHITAAVIIEMVHLATLVHDDVMDEAKIRRGRPTLAARSTRSLDGRPRRHRGQQKKAEAFAAQGICESAPSSAVTF